jgi:hypothetical protein
VHDTLEFVVVAAFVLDTLASDNISVAVHDTQEFVPVPIAVLDILASDDISGLVPASVLDILAFALVLACVRFRS